MSTSTPSRREQRERARGEREEREHEEALRAQRKRRLVYLGGGLLVLIAAVAIAIAVASGGGSSSSTSSSSGGGSGVAGASAVASEFAGIPQKGNVLGASSAPATMMVFADMQCPYCKQFETKVFPALVRRYVKTGKLKVVFQPIAIIGTDSVAGARAVGSAAQQNKMYEYASLFYDNQGEENTGYVTQDFLTKLAGAARGLDTAKWKSQLNSPGVESLLGQAQSAAQTAGVSSTPTFLAAKTGKPLQPFQVTALAPNAFYGKLDSLTK